MATRDVILRALGDFCWNEEAPLRFAMLDPHDLGLLAEVAAEAVEGQTRELERIAHAAAEYRAIAKTNFEWTDDDGMLPSFAVNFEGQAGETLDAALGPWQKANPPVGTPDEAEACAGRSGLGEVG